MAFVRRALAAGAENVEVGDLQPHPETGAEHANKVVIELPVAAAQRGRFFQWCKAAGIGPESEDGRRFVLLRFDDL